ncbi:hypothetical protein J6TS2_02580 [Heyndrickxia sporothermodurans]|nr:hypothetical protein J6TS2_02580 [Heyndrickxia sporothermodurans]
MRFCEKNHVNYKIIYPHVYIKVYNNSNKRKDKANVQFSKVINMDK